MRWEGSCRGPMGGALCPARPAEELPSALPTPRGAASVWEWERPSTASGLVHVCPHLPAAGAPQSLLLGSLKPGPSSRCGAPWEALGATVTGTEDPGAGPGPAQGLQRSRVQCCTSGDGGPAIASSSRAWRWAALHGAWAGLTGARPTVTSQALSPTSPPRRLARRSPPRRLSPRGPVALRPPQGGAGPGPWAGGLQGASGHRGQEQCPSSCLQGWGPWGLSAEPLRPGDEGKTMVAYSVCGQEAGGSGVGVFSLHWKSSSP